MAKKSAHVSETPATQWLRRQGVPFSEHVYAYVEHGGTAESARQLGVDEHAVVKTLVMQDEKGEPLVVLMHGDKQVSTKNLARAIGTKSVEPCSPDAAERAAATRSAARRRSRPGGRCRSSSSRRSSGSTASASTAAGAATWSELRRSVLTEQLGAMPVACAL